MRERVLVFLAITLFACVPMVQLVTADSGTADTSMLLPRWDTPNTVLGGCVEDAARGRFNLTDLAGSRFHDSTWSLRREMPSPRPSRPAPLPSIPVFPPSSPDPVIPDDSSSLVSITDLKVREEYVKISNRGSTAVTMTGWTLSSKSGRSISFIDYPVGEGSFYTFTLLPHSTLTIYSGREGTPTSFRLYWPEEMWNDSGDTAYLYNSKGVLVSSFTGQP